PFGIFNSVPLEFGILNLKFIPAWLYLFSSTEVTPMRYKRFEDLPVWNEAIELAAQIYALTAKAEFKSHWSLKDQIERAAVSVSNNFVESVDDGTNNELLAFLYIARGSAGEVRSMLCLLERIQAFR